MNPNFSPNPPYNYYTQNNTGPPQPQWQPHPPVPYRAGWQDPRVHTPSPSGYQPQSTSYNPNTYGPMPATSWGQPNVPYGQYPQPQPQPQHQQARPAVPHYEADTSGWGVKYNQQQQQQQHHNSLTGPPLPPRPSSANSNQANLFTRPEQDITPVSLNDLPVRPEAEKPTVLPSRQSWRDSFYTQALAEDAVPVVSPPPPPPPRPSEYQYQNQNQPQQHLQYSSSEWPHDQFSRKPASHHYDPANQQPWAGNVSSSPNPGLLQPSQTGAQHGWGVPQTYDTGPVSPEEKQHTRWEGKTLESSLPQSPTPVSVPHQNQPNSSHQNPPAVSNHGNNQLALNATISQGNGPPSDWERFTPTETQNGKLEPPHELSSASISSTQDPAEPKVERSSAVLIKPAEYHESQPKSHNSGPMAYASTPNLRGASTGQSTTSASELTERSGQYTNADSSSPRHGSLSSIAGLHYPQRSGTIDSVIEAWNAPLFQRNTPSGKTSIQQISVDKRPVSPPSQSQSPERLNERLGSPPRSNLQVSQEGVSATTIADSYKDIDPEYHSSLTRYLKMLKKETAASSDTEKYQIFQSFMQKEVRIRQALYGIEPEVPTPVVRSQTIGRKAVPATAVAFAGNPGPEPPLPETPSNVKRQSLGPDPEDKSMMKVAVPDAHNSKPSHNDGDTSVTGASHVEKLTDLSSLGTAPPPRAPDNSKVPAKLAQILTTALPGESETAEAHKHSESASNQASISEGKGAPAPTPTNLSTPPRTVSPKIAIERTPGSSDGSYVVINQDEEQEQYSPGGRPLLSRSKPTVSRAQNTIETARSPYPSPTARASQQAASPSNNAPMVIEDYVVKDTALPTNSAPVGIGSAENTSKSAKVSGRPLSGLVGPVKFEPPRPVYTPFRYNETTSKDIPDILLDKPADEEYSTLRTQAAESGRLLTHEVSPNHTEGASPIVSPVNARREHQETFLGLIRHQSKAMRKSSPGPNPPQLRVGTPLNPEIENPLTEAIAALRVILPTTMLQDGHLHPKIVRINSHVNAYPDEFGYIKESVISWDRVNKDVRKVQDEDRDKRQTGSEVYIDELFNSNEISYADIRGMEEDFKLAEAERKYQEDQEELQSFIDSVYTPVTERLQEEISKLTTNYVLAVDMLDLGSEAGSRFLSPDNERVQMAAAMDLVLHLFRKLEIRYQKVAEARFERERRSKKLELGVLYTNGNTAGMRSLEQEFTAAEKLQVLEEAQEKDKRANKLMDTFDRATVRGLGDNQTYVDDVLSKVRQLKEVILKDSQQPAGGLPELDPVRSILSSAQEALGFVLSDSRTILTTSNASDNLLNEADYRVSVAKARLANASETMFQKLQEDKSKEDAKIVEEMAVRMDSMAKGPAEATMLIQEIFSKIGEDPDHQDRIKRALEEAKKRNAIKDG